MKRREFFGAIGAGMGVPLLPGDVCLQDDRGDKLTVLRGDRCLWFVDVGRVNLRDLTEPYRPGKIVRCHGNPNECVKVYALAEPDPT